MRHNKLTTRHTFVNCYEFGGEMYLAEAVVLAEEEDIGLSITPEIHPDLEEAMEMFLDEWLEEVVDCHNELRKTVV